LRQKRVFFANGQVSGIGSYVLATCLTYIYVQKKVVPDEERRISSVNNFSANVVLQIMKASSEGKLRPIPNGKLMIIGGAEKKLDPEELKKEVRLEIHDYFIKLIGKKKPAIAVVTTASAEDVKGTFEAYKATFESICACTVFQIHHQSMVEIDEAEVAEQIATADALFFTGGDQLKLTSIYGGSMFLYHAKNRYIYQQLVVGGTSAGAMALSTPMIYAGADEAEMIAGEVKITLGFEFLKDVCIDTHFVHRGRFVRMAQVIATNPACIGIGIEENTAIVVTEGTHVEVVGTGVVIKIDGKKNTANNITEFGDSKVLSIRGLDVDILGAGQQFVFTQLDPPHL
jgi:cyanophycinase